MDNPLISVIVPAHNVEKYFPKCIDSILKQDYRNLEVVLVDDGSTDTTSLLCDQYAQKDSRVVVYHKPCGGVSDARNFGVSHAKGEYFAFVDSDDYVTEDYISYLWKLLKAVPGCKLSLCTLFDVYPLLNKIVDTGDGTEMVLSAKDCLEMLCYHDKVDTCVYAKLYHRSVFENIVYPVGRLFEDIGVTYQLIDKCPEISCGFKSKYYYIRRDNSIVTSNYNKMKVDMLEMTDRMASYVSTKYPDLKDATIRRQVYARFSTLNQMLFTSEDTDVKKEMISFIKDNERSVLKNSKTPKRDRVAIYSLNVGLWFYKLCWRVYLKVTKGV